MSIIIEVFSLTVRTVRISQGRFTDTSVKHFVIDLKRHTMNKFYLLTLTDFSFRLIITMTTLCIMMSLHN